MVRNHIANFEVSPARKKITKTPGVRRICEIPKSYNECFLSPPNLPEVSQSKPSSSMGCYQVSYYPASPLNSSFEESTTLNTIRNLKTVRLRSSSPGKNIRKINRVKYEAEFRKTTNLSILTDKNTLCLSCGMGNCICVLDKLSKEITEKIAASSVNDRKKDRYTSTEKINSPKISENAAKKIFIGKTTRRKKISISIDFDSLKKNLLIKPFLTRKNELDSIIAAKRFN